MDGMKLLFGKCREAVVRALACRGTGNPPFAVDGRCMQSLNTGYDLKA